MDDNKITATEIQDQVRHNLGCKPNGYLGYTYGSDILTTLQKPQASGITESFISKLKEDLPILSISGGVDVYTRSNGSERKEIVVGVAGGYVGGF